MTEETGVSDEAQLVPGAPVSGNSGEVTAAVGAHWSLF